MDAVEERRLAALERRAAELERTLASVKELVLASLGDRAVEGPPCQLDRRAVIRFLSSGPARPEYDRAKVAELLDKAGVVTKESVNAAFNSFYRWVVSSDRPVDDVNMMSQPEFKDYFCSLVNPLIAERASRP